MLSLTHTLSLLYNLLCGCCVLTLCKHLQCRWHGGVVCIGEANKNRSAAVVQTLSAGIENGCCHNRGSDGWQRRIERTWQTLHTTPSASTTAASSCNSHVVRQLRKRLIPTGRFATTPQHQRTNRTIDSRSLVGHQSCHRAPACTSCTVD
jgi:hypothetical protein